MRSRACLTHKLTLRHATADQRQEYIVSRLRNVGFSSFMSSSTVSVSRKRRSAETSPAAGPNDAFDCVLKTRCAGFL